MVEAAAAEEVEDGEGEEVEGVNSWASLVSDWSSCHGVAWYNRFTSPAAK